MTHTSVERTLFPRRSAFSLRQLCVSPGPIVVKLCLCQRVCFCCLRLLSAPTVLSSVGIWFSSDAPPSSHHCVQVTDRRGLRFRSSNQTYRPGQSNDEPLSRDARCSHGSLRLMATTSQAPSNLFRPHQSDPASVAVDPATPFFGMCARSVRSLGPQRSDRLS